MPTIKSETWDGVTAPAIATLHHATAQTFYVLTLSATTSSGRVLECRMPRLWRPD